jgi:phytoene dehydrogenase-like protein
MKTVLIAGAGVAGLSAGIYAQRSGLSSQIVEMNDVPGGLCTAWKRKGYTFDCCIHWLTGSRPDSNLHALWETVGAVQGVEFRTHEYFSSEADEKGVIFTAYADTQKLKQEMLRIAPEDAKAIEELCEDIDKFGRFDMPLDMDSIYVVLHLGTLNLFRKYSLPVSEMVKRFQSERLRLALSRTLGWHDQSAAFSLYAMGLMSRGDGGYPVGGSVPMVKAMEKRYLELGGKIRYGTKVEGVIVEEDVAKGMRTSAGEMRADAVISACDWHTTVFDWLEGRYQEKDTREMMQRLKPFPPIVMVFLGVKGEALDVPASVVIPAMRAIDPGDTPTTHLYLERKSADPAMAPPGKSVLSVTMNCDFDHWNSLRGDEDGYEAEKDRIGSEVIEALEAWRPGTRDAIEVVDIATPLTFERLTGNWRGSYQGWLWTREAGTTNLSNTLPGLKGLYLAGHWLSPGGGLPAAALTGRRAVRALCRDSKVKFRS